MTEETISQERPVRRVALCIGIGTYTHLPNQHLRYAVDDAQAMAEMLRDVNREPYEVRLLTEPLQTTKQEVQKALFQVLRTPGLQAEDLVLISISCHGTISEDGQLFCLLPSDAKVKPDRRVDPATVLDIYDLAQVLANAHVNNCVCFLDICHSGGAGAIFRHLPLNLSTDTNLFIIGAARQDQPAWQSSTVKHGFFTHAVLQAFEQQPDIEGWVTINQVLDFVSKEIRQRSSAEVARIQITSTTVDPSLPILRNPYYVPRTNVPFSPSPFFLGREEVLKDLVATFQITGREKHIQPQALCGLGGMGKTQLTLEYARRARRQYQAVLWADAETRESLLSSFVQMAQVLDLPEKEEQDQMRVVEGVKHWLHTQTKWLLILDNTEDPAMLHEFLPPDMSGHLLLTTRASTLGTFARCLPVESLDVEHSALLLLRRGRLLASDALLERAAEPDQAAARDLVDELAGLPLALDQAGAYIDETRCGVVGYLHRYRQERTVMLKRRGRYEQDYPHSVATTWSLSFEKVQLANPLAGDILSCCAFLHPDLIPIELVVKEDQSLTQVDEALEVLQRYSLIHRDEQTQMITVHRLVQAVLSDMLPSELRRQWMQRAVHAVAAAYLSLDYPNWATDERLLPHALICATWIKQAPLITPEATRLLSRAGTYLLTRARYAEAEPLYQHALAICEQEFGPTHPDTATSLANLALLYKIQGRYSEAEPLYQRTLTIREQMLGTSHLDTASSLTNLASLYGFQGRYSKAEPIFQRALAICEQTLGASHLDTASSLTNLAKLFKDQGKYAEAEPLFQRALAIREQELGPTHSDTATSLTNLAKLYHDQGKYAEEKPLYQRALAICEQDLAICEQEWGAMHPNTAASLVDLALLYRIQGRYSEAEPFFQRALAIREQTLGATHHFTASSLNNLAKLFEDQGKYAEAEPLYQRALAICEQELGPTHPDTATSLECIAEIYFSQRRYSEAEPLYQRVLAIREQTLGATHPDTATGLISLASLYRSQERYSEAEPLYRRALTIDEQMLGATHPDTAASLNNLAELYYAQGKYAEAKPLLQRALAIYEQELGPTHPNTHKTRTNYYGLLGAIGIERMRRGWKSVLSRFSL